MSPVRRPTLLFPILLLLLAALLAAGCGDSGESDNAGSGDSDTSETEGGDDADSGEDGATDDVAARNDSYDEAPKERLDPDTTYVVTMETSEGSFDIELDQEAAPIAAANFAFLVGEGYYDGIVFHRIIKDFMVQAGDPTGTGTGGPGYSLKDDPVKGSYTRGTVAMANAGPDTGGSQFFIVHGTEVDQQLGKDYVIFGEVDKEGMETVDKIADVEVEAGPTGEPSQPVETVRIEEATLAER